MYYQSPSPGGRGGGQWNATNPPSSQSQNWSPQPPPGGRYTPWPQQLVDVDPLLSEDAADAEENQTPPISQAILQQSAMQTMQPQHPDQYRALPPPQQMYAPPYQPHPHMAYPPPQPPPRQRTAIACRYCRRRKIRCSGFDQSEDGRCTTCVRFSQECVFTPVHAEIQAFVPAHAVWRSQGGPPPNTQLYGAYGQPLPHHGDRNQLYPPQQGQAPPRAQYPPSPQGYQQPPIYQQQPPPQQQAGQKRSTDEPHTPTLPPPPSGAQTQMGKTREGQPFTYTETIGLRSIGASPAFSHAFFRIEQPTQPSYTPSYLYEDLRAQCSPQAYRQPAQVSIEPSASAYMQQQQQAQAAQALRQEERTSHDSTMVQALRRGPM
ncbi:uncharacterized protein LTR77_010964 [Saxophila tyrrhenica]|uniref:Zn(2)-C6 fungal-type domain-containing protein n=1 Tax=Saxophila tyrrhenica TaxID=1690608 RepID=A0AAV9NWI0_9PEZI|nr:hypothetical protein LTR77_010964 [Saxophila tyrrhenica]